MRINGEELKTIAVFPNMMTVPDCVVVQSNKLGRGHGEAKFYVASKEEMYHFYGGEQFTAKCFMLKKDLLAYMIAIKNEYYSPSLEYQKKDELPQLWEERMKMINELDEVIFFTIQDQYQISGPRGYIKSEDAAYQIIRNVALPTVSYIYVEKVGNEKDPLFYWKLFVDFLAVTEIKNGALVFKYGKVKKDTEERINFKKAKTETIRQARMGQGRYREKLLEQCRYCPFTMIADERLLIASHIKPWVASNDKEKVDPYNGYMLSPLYDKLFDRGFITLTSTKHVILSQFISPYTWRQIGLKDNSYIHTLVMDDKRMEYLKFHQQNVFKGTYEFDV